MIEKQKKTLHNKYERLTMNSVGKRTASHSRGNAFGPHSGSKLSNNRSGTRLSSQAKDKVSRQSSQDESTNIIINQRGFDLKTPARDNKDIEGNPTNQATPLATHIKYTPLAHRYEIQKSPTENNLSSPVKSPEKLKKESSGTRSRARKSRKERMS